MKVDDHGIRRVGGQIAKIAAALQHGKVHPVADRAQLFHPLRTLVSVPVDQADAVHGENGKSSRCLDWQESPQ